MRNDIIQEVQDFTDLSWSRCRRSSGTAGSFLKAQTVQEGTKYYYKLSNYDAYKGIIGHECINELIADRLLTILEIDHLHYQLIHADILIEGRRYRTWLCGSRDYRQPGESKTALDIYYQLEREKEESPLAFCVRKGWSAYIYSMLLVDFLILNRDRHGANMEVLKNRRTKTIRLAPLFDHGLSLLFSCANEDQLVAWDVMEDRPVQSFVGSRSAYDNLSLIPRGEEPQVRPLQASDQSIIMKGLDQAAPTPLLEKAWEMIWRRWEYYENFCHTR